MLCLLSGQVTEVSVSMLSYLPILRYIYFTKSIPLLPLYQCTSHHCKDTNMAEENNSSSESFSNSQVMYRCKKCRRIVATHESIVTHERGKGESCFKWSKRSGNSRGIENKPADCTSIFVEPMKWMETCKIKQIKSQFSLLRLFQLSCSLLVEINSFFLFD